MTTKITILVDNHAKKPGLVAEHGFSAIVEHNGFRLLFDTGCGEAINNNARVLGVDLGAMNALVLSHGHHDHTGGLVSFLTSNSTARIYLHPHAVVPRYGRRPGNPPHANGMPVSGAAQLMSREKDIVWTQSPCVITEGIHVTGSILRLTPFETPGGPFFLDADCTQTDEISDDQALWLETENGIMIVTGCAHAGVVNTMNQVVKMSNSERIHAVIGGMHLEGASDERLAATVAAFQRYQVDCIMPRHCTGARAIAYLCERLPEQVVVG